MDSKIKAVKVSMKRAGSGHIQLVVTLPMDFARELGIGSGDILFAEVMEVDIRGSKRKAVVYYKP
jgi:hypothetical protein